MNERKMVATESTESFLARVKSVAHKLDKGEPVARSLTISYGEPAEPLQSLHLIEEAAMNSVRDEARKLVEQDEVALMFGMLGTALNTATRPYLNQKKVPQLFLAAGSATFASGDKFPWTIGWPPPLQI